VVGLGNAWWDSRMGGGDSRTQGGVREWGVEAVNAG
jgi:hypothetical protein